LIYQIILRSKFKMLLSQILLKFLFIFSIYFKNKILPHLNLIFSYLLEIYYKYKFLN
jgi:hypothetical protein